MVKLISSHNTEILSQCG